MPNYAKSLKGTVTLFVKGEFIKGLDTPTLPSDVKTIDISSMFQRHGRIICAFTVIFHDGSETPHCTVSFDISDRSSWIMHGAYLANLFQGDADFTPVRSVREACCV